MRCPDWRLLSSLQDRDPEAWERGLEHFDRCDRCRDLALAAEPTLIFRRLPAPAVDGGDVTAMKQAVAVLRRSHLESERAAGRLPAAWRQPALLRAAALAALVIGAVALQDTGSLGLKILGETGFADDGAVAELGSRTWSSADLPRIEDLPLVEAVDPSYGSVVEVVDDEISLALVLPPYDV